MWLVFWGFEAMPWGVIGEVHAYRIKNDIHTLIGCTMSELLVLV